MAYEEAHAGGDGQDQAPRRRPAPDVQGGAPIVLSARAGARGRRFTERRRADQLAGPAASASPVAPRATR